jgi:hypothetical protein
MRLLLIIGAAICFAIGLKMTFEILWYHIAFETVPYFYTAVAYLPLILIAPCYSISKKRPFVTCLAVTEIVVIGMTACRMFVIR